MEVSAPVSTPVAEAPAASDTQAEAASQTAQDEAKAEAKRKLKVKIDGQVHEVDEDEVINDYGKGKAADKKFQEAAALRKEAVAFIEALKKDPISVLTNPKLGVNMREVAETYLLAQLEDEMMDPRDRELRDLKKEKMTREQMEAETKRQAEEAEMQALTENYRAEYERAFQACLESSGLPKTPHTVKRLAFYMNEGMKRGLDLKPDDVVGLVKDEYIEEQKTLFSSLDGENLLKLLGDDLAKKIRKYDTSRVVQPQKISLIDQPNVSERAIKKAERVSKEEWKAKMDRIKAGLE
ncbi:MAG: hypothetical protein E6R04_06535 [Spirochaetes bacterium]|nr:MAG: hypothetical protein E6R04_06535 [Spirochaetota bacterium]